VVPARLTPFGAVYDPRTLVSLGQSPRRPPQVVAGPIDNAAPRFCEVKCNVFVFS